MSFRGTESPMDFEWQSRTGPADVNSPFHRYAMENQRKRPHSQFDSPNKPTTQALREPNSQPFLFSQPISQAEPSPYRAPSFTTPRKPLDFNFDSSGPENSSPAEQADNEDTPEPRSSAVDFTSNDVKPTNKRNSLFGQYGRFAPSPNRTEAKKPNYSNAIARKVHKKRRRAENFDKQMVTAVRRLSEDSSEEDNGPNHKSKSKTEEVGWMTGLFTFIHAYPDAPSIIAKYLQVFFNALICAGCLYMIYSFWATIQADVDKASEDAMAEVLSEMAACTKNYIDNRCGSDQRLPALETICSNWELCMNRDPSAVRRARLSAHTFAEILNSFVEPISLKTMLFSVTLVVIGLIVNNATFTLFRRSQVQHHEMPRQPSGPFMHAGQQTPGHFGYIDGPGAWQHQQKLDFGYGGQQRLEFDRSPSKDYAKRSRSRSPEKRMILQ